MNRDRDASIGFAQLLSSHFCRLSSLRMTKGESETMLHSLGASLAIGVIDDNMFHTSNQQETP